MTCKKCRKEIAKDWIHCPWCGSKQVRTKRKAIKRENGTGSVYKRSDLKKRPWVAATPAKGIKPAEIIGYFATAQEAKDSLADFRKHPTTKLNITLKGLYEEWYPVGTKGKSDKTKEMYVGAYKKLIELENEKFRHLRTGQYQKIIDILEKGVPKLDDNGDPIKENGQPVMAVAPLAYDTLRHVKVLLSSMYKYAMQNDIVNKNYAEFIKLPKKPKGVKPAFSDLELKTVEKSVGKIEFADCIYFMCYTGLRITEFITLTKFQVHEKGKVCALHGGIKTEAGEDKIVPVHEKIKPILRKWMAKNGEAIFCRPDGTPYTTNYFRKYCFYPALEKMGIQENKSPRHFTPHATRRTFATMLSKANVREEDFISMMGHADFDVSIESYIYQTAEKLQHAIEMLS